MISGSQFKEWLEQLPDQQVDGFEEAVHAAGEAFSECEHDGMIRNCISGLYGENPYVWALALPISIGRMKEFPHSS